MPAFLRTVACYAFAILISFSGFFNRPDSVLCVGPGSHCHFEIVVGTSCSETLPASDTAMPDPRDGCPKGSKDLRLGMDVHRADNNLKMSVSAPLLAIASRVGDLADPYREPAQPLVFPSPPQSRIPSAVLRC